MGAACKPPPGIDEFPTKPDGDSSSPPDVPSSSPSLGPCEQDALTFGTAELLPTSPQDFADAYEAELEQLPAGPFAVRLHGLTSADPEDRSATIYGIASDGSNLTQVSPIAEYSFTVAKNRTLALNGAAEFSLVFPDVTLDITALSLTAMLDSTCTKLTNVSATLHLRAAPPPPKLNNHPLVSLLGPSWVVPGKEYGWDLPFAGNLEALEVSP